MPSVDAMLSHMSASELVEWDAWYRATMPDRVDYYFQQLLALTANAAGGKKGGGRFEPKDFAPDLRTSEERVAAELRKARHEADVERMRKRGVEVLEQQRKGA